MLEEGNANLMIQRETVEDLLKNHL
jgi:hypothetical protein